MFIRRLLISLGVMVAATGVALAAPHAPTYAKRVAPLGTVFELNGQSYTLVKAPFKVFEGGKYAIIYPRATYFGGTGFKIVHSDKPLTPNATISGFPAYLSIQDSRSYELGGAIGLSGTLDVRGLATGTATIQIGTTRVSVSLYQIKDLPDWVGDPNGCCAPYSETHKKVGGAVDVVSHAEWTTWRDLKAEATALDTLFDYIQIIPL